MNYYFLITQISAESLGWKNHKTDLLMQNYYTDWLRDQMRQNQAQPKCIKYKKS